MLCAKMLNKETETEETTGLLSLLLSILKFQLRRLSPLHTTMYQEMLLSMLHH